MVIGKGLFMEDLLKKIESDKEELRIIYQEDDALIVEHGESCYSKNPEPNNISNLAGKYRDRIEKMI